MHNTINISKALKQQQNEIDDFTIYSMLAQSEKNDANKVVFQKIAHEEKGH